MIEIIVESKPRPVGTITVARVLPSLHRRTVGPFVFLDHMGPLELAPGVGHSVLPHPHIGLSTVTYFFSGANVHRDSIGSVVTNVPGDVNLMTAGAGIVHSERGDPATVANGGTMHGVQIWLGLPVAHEDDAPSFEHHPKATLPEIAPAAGARGRVLIGAAFGARSPIAHPSRPLLVDLELDSGAEIAIPDADERAVLVISGEVAIGETSLATNHLAVIAPGAAASITARGLARALVLGGPPLDGARHLDWNFVSSSMEKLAAARARWQARGFPPIPGDDVELVPYPEWKVKHP
jgi:redox-sensitive bicupin YhaK (pirin superfamily)